jgi:hypothetical protein
MRDAAFTGGDLPQNLKGIKMKDNGPATGDGTSSARTLWVYGYEMIPPHQVQEMRSIRELLGRENAEAKRQHRSWTARLITEHQATHVLIVSSTPEQDREVNRKLETELKALGVDFLRTLPVPVSDDPEP